MLTTRSTLVLGFSALGLVVALLGRHEPLALISLSALVWIWIEWLSFQRFKIVNPILQDCQRLIDGQPEERATMVADRDVLVRLSGVLPVVSQGYRFLIHDMLPDTFQVTQGKPFQVIDSGMGTTFDLSYAATTSICGKVSFQGFVLKFLTIGASFVGNNSWLSSKSRLCCRI